MHKTKLLFSAILFLFLMNIHSQTKIKKVLVTDFYFGYHHNAGRELNVAMIQQIGKEEGFEVVVAKKDAEFTPDKLEGTDVVVIQNLTATSKINKNMQDALIKWVTEKGGGIFTTHATLDGAKGEWDWIYDNGIYGHYVPHSKIVPATMLVDPEATDQTTKAIHPILKDIGDFDEVDVDKGTIVGWTEEWFNWKNYFRGADNLQILLSMDLKSYDCGRCMGDIPDDHPAFWITEPVGPKATGGSVSYFLAGHGPEVHQCKIGEYKNNEGKKCNGLLKNLYKNAILYHGGALPKGPPPVHVKNYFSKGREISVSESELSFDLEGSHNLQVFDVSGSTVFTDKSSSSKHYSLSNLKSGIYFIKATISGKVSMGRVLVP